MGHTDEEILVEHLRKMNCDDAEIEKIMERLREYDHQTIREAVFESIETGSFDLDAIIEEVRGSDKT